MGKSAKNFWRYRPLLTETLPYELPVIFSNDRLYYSRCRSVDIEAQPLLANIYKANRGYTIPYNFGIRKDRDRVTQLSLVHPTMQLEFCEFYERHEASLLKYCNRSHYSLRHPAAVAAVYVLSLTEVKESIHKTGEVHLNPDGAEPSLAKLVSYFSYEKFNLLNKFYESREFIRLERRFEFIRQIDVSKCFYSIYTHSVAWAVKSKEFAKDNTKAYSFESSFDSLMQRSNYNETNGIVVGPEFSRVFAEIILQDIDVSVHDGLLEDGLVEGLHYSIRRYVDDYSIFANSDAVLDKIERLMRHELQKYKLYVNESKVSSSRRPFVSGLTQARDDVKVRVARVLELIKGSSWLSDDAPSSGERHNLGSLVHDVRVIVRRYDIKLNSLSGNLIGSLRAVVRQATKILDKKSPVSVEKWILLVRCVMDCAFYVVSTDLRVRTTYSLCQLLAMIKKGATVLPPAVVESIEFRMAEELSQIIQGAMPAWIEAKNNDSVEISNLLVCGSSLLQERFTANGEIVKILDLIAAQDLTYFKYITLKYCYLRDVAKFQPKLDALNAAALSLIDSSEVVKKNSELFLLLCDYLSAPDIAAADKRALYVKLYKGNPSNAAFEKLSQAIGFTDWTGLSIAHTLTRRQMRPVYAVA